MDGFLAQTINQWAATNKPGGRNNAITWTTSGNPLWLFGGVGYGATGLADWQDLGASSEQCAAACSYQFTDNHPLPVNYYRLQAILPGGQAQYSRVEKPGFVRRHMACISYRSSPALGSYRKKLML
jgi:hypothetical protein